MWLAILASLRHRGSLEDIDALHRRIRSGPHEGKMASQPLPSWGSPMPREKIREKIRSGPNLGKMAT